MKKLLFFFILVLSVSATMAQNVQFSQGDKKKTISFNGGLYVHGVTYLGRTSDTTSAAISTMTSAAVTAPTREGGQVYDSTTDKSFLYRGSTLKFIQIGQVIIKDTTMNFASTSAGTSSELTVTISEAALGDNVMAAPLTAASYVANSSYSAYVSAAGTIKVRLNNYSSGPVDPASSTFRIMIIK